MSGGENKYKVAVEIKPTMYLKLKVRLLLFFSYFMDVSQWIENLAEDISDSGKRYVRTKVTKIDEGADE